MVNQKRLVIRDKKSLKTKVYEFIIICTLIKFSIIICTLIKFSHLGDIDQQPLFRIYIQVFLSFNLCYGELQ